MGKVGEAKKIVENPEKIMEIVDRDKKPLSEIDNKIISAIPDISMLSWYLTNRFSSNFTSYFYKLDEKTGKTYNNTEIAKIARSGNHIINSYREKYNDGELSLRDIKIHVGKQINKNSFSIKKPKTIRQGKVFTSSEKLS